MSTTKEDVNEWTYNNEDENMKLTFHLDSFNFHRLSHILCDSGSKRIFEISEYFEKYSRGVDEFPN